MIFLLISMTYVHFETAATLCFPQIFPNISISGDVGGAVYIDTAPHGGVARRWFCEDGYKLNVAQD